MKLRDKKTGKVYLTKVYLTKEEREAAEKTIELIKQSGYDKTLKELEKDD